ncbi:MAG: glycosyl hydrolase family 28-related protein, partial [Pseudomonadota bacterium]
DDGLDDTAAVNQALADHPDGNFIIYLPDGQYDISDRLDWPAAPGGGTGTEQDWRYTVLQGQSRDGTVIQLADAAPGYTDPASPRAMLWTGTGAAQRFRNAVRDLTLHTGSGNAGAVGMQFKANNQGGIFNVRIVDGDNSGVRGIDFRYANEIGPLLVRDVVVEGFNVGVDIFFNVNSLTFENLTLRNQRVYGLRNRQQSVSIRGLVSENAVPALYMFNQGSYTTLVDSTLTGIGDAANQSAIIYGSGLFVRNVTTTGYANAITFLFNGTTPAAQVSGPVVDEFTSTAPLATCDNLPRSLNLPVADAPVIPWGDPAADWVNIDAFGAVSDTSGGDDSAAIQAALNDGAATVYVPASGQFPRSYRMETDVNVPAHVRRIIGTEGRIGGAGRFLLAEDGEPVIFERFQSLASGVVHTSARTAVFSSMGLKYEAAATGAGDVFLQDVVGGPWAFNGQRVWGRQVNTEQDGTNIVNNGSDLWILGIKTEKRGTVIETINGGRTEVLGGMLYTTSPTTDDPAFVTTNAAASIAGMRETNFGANPYAVPFAETRNGVTSTLPAGNAPGGVGGFAAPLYTAYVADGPNAAPQVSVGDDINVFLADTDTVALTGHVNDDGLPTGDCRVPVQWVQVSGPPGATIADAAARETQVTFAASGAYEFALTADDGQLTATDS